MHAPFKLSGSGEEVGLYNADTTSLDYVRYGALPDDISIGRFPNGHGAFNILIPTFAEANTNSINTGLVINEYQASNESTAQDQWGGFEDWVELYNNSNQPIDLSGYFLSDKIGDPTQFQFPDTVLAGNAYLIIWCDQGLMEPGLHTFFKLGSGGDDILLSNADTLTVDYIRYAAQIPDDSEGRYGNGTGPISCLIPSFAESNGFPLGLVKSPKLAKLEIWPNPSTGIVNFTSEAEPNSEVQIFNYQGRLVFSTVLRGRSSGIDLSALGSGVYLVKSGDAVAKLILR